MAVLNIILAIPAQFFFIKQAYASRSNTINHAGYRTMKRSFGLLQKKEILFFKFPFEKIINECH